MNENADPTPADLAELSAVNDKLQAELAEARAMLAQAAADRVNAEQERDLANAARAAADELLNEHRCGEAAERSHRRALVAEAELATANDTLARVRELAMLDQKCPCCTGCRSILDLLDTEHVQFDGEPSAELSRFDQAEPDERGDDA